MKTLGTIKNDLQIIEDNLGLCINDLNETQVYINNELANDVLKSMAFMYENDPPTDNLTYKLNISIYDVVENYLNRIVAVFTAANKIFILECNN